MRTRIPSSIVTALLCLVAVTDLFAQGAGFIYQGRLNSGGAAYTGHAEFLASLWDAASGGGPQVAINNPSVVTVPVTNGLFVLPLNFGPAPFAAGAARWLQLEVRTNPGAFTVLAPRQFLTPTPYAITAGNLTGILPAGQLSGAIPSANLVGAYSGVVTFNNAANSFNGSHSGTGGALTRLNASQLAAGTVPDARLGANVARTSQVWLLGGNAGTAPGAQFLGTTDNQPLEFKVNGLRALRLENNGDGIDSGSTPDGAPNVIGGSASNFVAADVVGATISGGGATNYANTIRINTILGDYGVVGGGLGNRVGFNAFAGAIAGGFLNDIGTNSQLSAIGGGFANHIAANAAWSTVAGGRDNDVGTNAFSSAIGGGWNNNIAAYAIHATIAGGRDNHIGTNADNGTVGGGFTNSVAANSTSATIAGGSGNAILTNAQYATISGGSTNAIQSDARNAAIGGGNRNHIAANASSATIAGGEVNGISTNSDSSTVSGGSDNNIGADSFYATIAGGQRNEIGANSDASTIGGGGGNSIEMDSASSAIAGGLRNNIEGNSFASVIAGGSDNVIRANAFHASIPGGAFNEASGDYSFAAGHRAKALGQGAFVWADSQDADFNSPIADSVFFRCQGGVRFTSGDAGLNQTVSWLPGFASWSFSSDRDLKEAVTAVGTREVLDKVARLPVNEWNFKGHSRRHIGPMAQDFHAQFPLNDDDKMIDSGDLHGVALAAIQGLNQKLEEEIQAKAGRIDALEKEMSALKNILMKLNKN